MLISLGVLLTIAPLVHKTQDRMIGNVPNSRHLRVHSTTCQAAKVSLTSCTCRLQASWTWFRNFANTEGRSRRNQQCWKSQLDAQNESSAPTAYNHEDPAEHPHVDA